MRIIIALTLVLILVSCSSNNQGPDLKRVVIAGKVINPDPMKFKVDFSINRIGIGNERISPTLDNDGAFNIVFESYTPLDVWIQYKMNFLILTHPGDSIYLEFDGSKEDRPEILKTVKYKGDASRLNAEAAAFQLLYFSNDTYKEYETRSSKIKSYNEIEYKYFRDSLRREEQDLLNEFISEHNPLEESKNWAKTFLDVGYYRDLISYPDYHRKQNNLQKQDWNVPLSYFDFLNNHFPINDSVLISSYSIQRFVNFYPIYLFERLRNENLILFNSPDYFQKNPEVWDSLKIYGTIKYTKDPLLREMVLTELLRQDFDKSNTTTFKKYEQIISETITEPFLKIPLYDLYLKINNNLENPIQAADAVLKKLEGTSVETDIKNIIKSNVGKVIYLDCWATWCGPCIAELPNSKKLMRQYKQEDVAFIFICLDSEEKNWKAILSKQRLGGQHYFLTKDQSSEFRNAFNIKGVPHYILFDTKGNVSENGTQSPLFIKDKLEKLLIEK